jgi:hypothetical protein
MKKRLSAREAYTDVAKKPDRLIDDTLDKRNLQCPHSRDVITNAMRTPEVAVLRKSEPDLHGFALSCERSRKYALAAADSAASLKRQVGELGQVRDGRLDPGATYFCN